MARADVKKKARSTKLPTKRRLGNISAHYLKRFSSSAENLRRVLRRRVLKMTLEAPDLRPAAFLAVDEVVAELVGHGLINDVAYAAAKVRADQAMKKPRAKTAAKLRAKGVAKATIQKALDDESSPDADFEAGLAIARRRRLGPFRVGERTREIDRKDLGVLARSGLDFATAKRVMAWTED
jgi:regulatory protein